MVTFGRLRLRRDGDDTVEVWVRGWRLELRILIVAPLAMAVAFLASPVPWSLRVLGCAGMAACAWVVFRLGRLGIRLGTDGVEVVHLLRSDRVAWDDVVGFVAERDGHAALLTRGGARFPTPGVLAAGELQASDLDELNGLLWAVRRGDPLPV